MIENSKFEQSNYISLDDVSLNAEPYVMPNPFERTSKEYVYYESKRLEDEKLLKELRERYKRDKVGNENGTKSNV